ncbi:MAG: hypothetical protein JRJ47_02510 [Deltaproteobacteria bacterium]|nr:hypothetical protein [Deltaproteobacteria bacterium]
MSVLPIRPWLSVFVLATALLFIGSCSKVVHITKPAAPFFTEAYEPICEAWSRNARIYRAFSAELIATATYKSKEYRRAYTDEYAEAYKLTDEAKQEFWQDQLDALTRGSEFVMASFVSIEQWDDFHRADSMWKIYLVNDQDDRVVPAEIRQFKRQGKIRRRDAVKSHFLPYDTPWKSVYTIRFPYDVPGTNRPLISEETKSVKLIITSVLGTAQMEWNFENIDN